MNIDRAFVDRVEAILGPAANVEVTDSGRTVLRYDATTDEPCFAVSLEGRHPVACRRVTGGMEFAAVWPNGLGEWGRSKLGATRPSGEPVRPPHSVDVVKRLAQEGMDPRAIAIRLHVGKRLVESILAAT